MPRSSSIYLVTLALIVIVPSTQAGTTLALDSGLSFTSNADLSQNDPESDRILRLGALTRFPLDDSLGKFALRYIDYAKHRENDLLAANFGVTWTGNAQKKETEFEYGLRASLRDYVHDQAGTTDDSFTHYGVIGSATWKTPVSKTLNLEITPQVDLEHYPKYADRNDIDSSIRGEFGWDDSADSFELSVTPGILISSVNDFSKIYAGFSAEYDHAIHEDMHWGANVSITPSFYTSRSAGTSAFVLSRNGKKGSTTTTAATEKEETLLITPGVWWSKKLAEDWELRAETFFNDQSSKSDAYNFF
jgi:hypothetical protein